MISRLCKESGDVELAGMCRLAGRFFYMMGFATVVHYFVLLISDHGKELNATNLGRNLDAKLF